MTYIIAEAGTTHYATDPKMRLENAVYTVNEAAGLGVDALKWQLFSPDEPLFCPLEGDEQRWDRWKNTIMGLDQWKFVKALCKEVGIDFLASVFQHKGVELLKELKPKYYKVASRAAETFPYYTVPGPFLVSNGLTTRKLLTKAPIDKDAYCLHCVSEYPVPLERASWDDRLAGLSDHSGTVWPGLDAIFRGADFLEVHYKPSGLSAGPDDPVALMFKDVLLLCDANRAKEKMT